MRITTTVTGLRGLYEKAGAHTRESQRALKTAIQVEGFRQLKALREEMRAGRPGGRKFKELSFIARRTLRGAMKKNQVPLYKLARLLRYNVEYDRGGNISHLSFGFVNTNNRRLSGSYKSLLIKHQEGADVLYAKSRTELGRKFARIGGRLKEKGDPDARYFFLRHSTGRRIDLPERPIIDPFWKAHEDDAWKNIQSNFRRKMRGERI